jgi:UDP-N-acetylmuramyl pentapeptide phosphotransferase/UDP-N-acetylglucosamine-1-phosphate transferase
LASGVALIATVLFFFSALKTGNTLVVIRTAALTGGILGFLGCNFKDKDVFLGNVDGLFLGYIIAALAIENNYCELFSNRIVF